jgi:hypothetical protein
MERPVAREVRCSAYGLGMMAVAYENGQRVAFACGRDSRHAQADLETMLGIGQAELDPDEVDHPDLAPWERSEPEQTFTELAELATPRAA